MNCTTKVIAALENYGSHPKRNGKGWQARCPAHEDKSPSLSVTASDDGKVLLYCHAGCDAASVCGALGLTMADLMPPDEGFKQPRNQSQNRNASKNDEWALKPKAKPKAKSPERALSKSYPTADAAVMAQGTRDGKHFATWVYHDANGNEVGAVVRWNQPDGKKKVRPLRKDNDGWRIGAMNEPRPLYGLPTLTVVEDATAHPVVYIVEGEKCVDAAELLELTATTWAGGSKASGKTDLSPLAGRDIVLLADNDTAGTEAMDTVTATLMALHPRPTVRRVDLPRLEPKQDLADWIVHAFGEEVAPESIVEELEELVAKTDPVKAIESAEPVEVKEPPRYQPFPVECLPDPLKQLVVEGAKAIGCDESYIALPLLTAVATAIGTTRCLQVKRGWMVPSILWTAIIGESGTSKSPAFRLAMKPFRKLQRKAHEENAEEEKQYAEEKKVYKKAFNKWEKAGKGEESPPDEPKTPQAVRYIVIDTTVEALAPLLQDNPRGLLVARDELNGWLQSFGQYNGKGGADSSQWLSMYSADELTVDRRTGTTRTIYVPTASVSITGGIQPGILTRALGKEHRESGMAARLLMAQPPRRAKRWIEADVDPAITQEVEALFAELLKLEPEIDEEGRPHPVAIQLGPEAKTAWVEYYDKHAKEQADLTGDLAAAWSKLEETPVRLALVMHLVRYAAGDVANDGSEDGFVTQKTMRDAITLTQWFKNEALRVYDQFEDTEEDRERRRLIEWITGKGESVTVREVQQGCRWLKETGVAEVALNDLVEANLGCWQVEDTATKQRTVFKLSTASTSTDSPKTRDSSESVDVDSVDGSENHSDRGAA